ncbi:MULTISPECIES: hypothetical protein [unclassified Burkholderia]|uniref:hypothetical protein n=1 Tax=unclassified Burkholderia TaxID=2613784 RepID=UPI002AB2FD7C|nr:MULTISPECIES: hypothetical protein [unclassified Burkholderia]
MQAIFNPRVNSWTPNGFAVLSEDRDDDLEWSIGSVQMPGALTYSVPATTRSDYVNDPVALMGGVLMNGTSGHVMRKMKSLGGIVGIVSIVPEQCSATASVSVTDSVVNLMCRLSADGEVTHAVKVAFGRVERSFAEFDVDLVDELLAKVVENKSYLHARILTGLLRSTFRAKEHLYSWNNLLLATREELQGRGLNTQRLLSGLR